MNDVIARALDQHECALIREGVRLVVLLDGLVVHAHLGPARTESRHLSEQAARDAFVARIEQAFAEGFSAMHRDPPKREPMPPRTFPSPIPFALPPPPPSPPRPSSTHGAWEISAPFVRVEFGSFDDPEWSTLLEAPPEPDVSHLEVFVLADAADAFETVAEEGVPRWARGLTLASFEGIEEFTASELDCDAHWPHLSHVRRLELRAGHIHLPPLALGELQHLEVWCASADEALISSLCAEPWPELRSLRLWLAREGQPGLPAAALKPLMDRTRFPKLTSLGLHATSENGPLLERIRASSLGPQLTTLVIDGAVSVGELPEPSGIELLSTGEFFPLRSGRF